LSRISRTQPAGAGGYNGCGRTRGRDRMRSTRFVSGAVRREAPPALTNLDASDQKPRRKAAADLVRMLLSFQRPWRLGAGGASSAGARSETFPSGHWSVARPESRVQGPGSRSPARRRTVARGAPPTRAAHNGPGRASAAILDATGGPRRRS